ncbi:MAG: response regulator transcription factor [Bacteroidota bacterium]
MIKVYIVDDHRVLAEALVDFLNSHPGITCVGAANSAEEAIEQVEEIKPHVILMDIGMPGMNGIDCCKTLIKKDKHLKIIGLSTHMEVSVVKSLFKAGAKGYVSKSANLQEIPIAVEKVYNGQRYIGEIIHHAVMEDLEGEKSSKKINIAFIPRLTQREMEVLDLIAKEFTTEEIAKELFISTNTVQTHRKNLISKFGVRNSVGLVLKALELELI